MSGKEWPGDRGEVREAAGVGGIGLIGCFCGGDWELRLKDTEERFTQRYDGSLLGWGFFSPLLCSVFEEGSYISQTNLELSM